MPRKLDIQKVCQHCRKEKPTTREREYKTPNFTGPCGDSFCYRSCTDSSCHPQRASICDECEKKLTTKKAPKAGKKKA